MASNIIGRIGLAGAGTHHHGSKRHNLAPRGDCNLLTGDLYVFPNHSSTVDASQDITFKWNTACAITSPQIDLYLYNPAAANSLIRAWRGVEFSTGSFTTKLPGANATTSTQLQMNIVDPTQPSWSQEGAAGPVFVADYSHVAVATTASGTATSGKAMASQSQDAVFQDVSSNQTHKINKGVIAAAVIVPLLVLAVVTAVAIRFWRAREQEKRRRWSQALSTHSNLEWEKGAQPGEKPSSILGRPSTQLHRPSTQHSARPMSYASSSVYAVENNMAGAGARPSFSQMRSVSAKAVQRASMVLPDGQVRQSRISFAETARPDRRSRLSLGGDLRPEVGGVSKSVFNLRGASKSANDLNVTPAKRAAYATGSAIDDDEQEDINISPSQMQGPKAFEEAESRRIANGRRTGTRKSIISFGGGDKQRESTASAWSADDFRTAASARGSVDELRDMEAVMLMRRSILSQHSATRSTPNLDGPPTPVINTDTDQLENLNPDPVPAPMPAMPSPIAGSATVAYGPDQMLAVYAARAKSASPSNIVSPTLSVPVHNFNLPAPKPAATRQNSGMRLLNNLAGGGGAGGKKNDNDKEAMPPPPAPGDMRSYVHLNNGVVSSAVVDALPHPGPVIGGRGVSDGSRYSEGEEVGEAK